MDEATEVSWIFMAIGYASETEPADFASISLVADGINHAVPTHKEMQTSLAFLLKKSLILKQGKKYSLSKTGATLLADARAESKTLFEVWDALKIQLKKYVQVQP
jgi:hypothetical protein